VKRNQVILASAAVASIGLAVVLGVLGLAILTAPIP
jgi:hypothetical protein